MGYDIDKMIENAKSGNAKELLRNMSDKDAQKIKDLLADKEATQKLLASEQAQKILEMLKRGGIIGG